MPRFTLKLAGQTVAVSSLFESTRDYCRDYLTEESACMQITVTKEDLSREQLFLNREADREGLRRRVFAEPFLERNFLLRRSADLLASKDILLLHGSAVSLDGQGYLFVAGCGTGKSTHARLWREVLGARCVNDDKPFLHVTDREVLLCGSPWTGKHGLGENICVPLAAVCCLERGKETVLTPLQPREELLLGYACRGEADRPLVKRLLDQIPLWRLVCTPTPDAAVICCETLKRKEL